MLQNVFAAGRREQQIVMFLMMLEVLRSGGLNVVINDIRFNFRFVDVFGL